MSDFDRNVAAARGGYADRAAAVDAGLRAHMIRVYNYMARRVALTGVVAWLTYQAAGGDADLRQRRRDHRPDAVRPGGVRQLAAVRADAGAAGARVLLSFRIDRLQAGTARALFFVYAGCSVCRWRRSFSPLPAVDHPRVLHLGGGVRRAQPVGLHHAARSAGMGSFLFMGLIGIILASIVNIFLKSSGLDWIISVIGVLVFAGLTAYDTQKIKEMYSVNDDGTVAGRKAVMGALSLYLDFINLFLMLLRLVGDRR